MGSGREGGVGRLFFGFGVLVSFDLEGGRDGFGFRLGVIVLGVCRGFGFRGWNVGFLVGFLFDRFLFIVG